MGLWEWLCLAISCLALCFPAVIVWAAVAFPIIMGKTL